MYLVGTIDREIYRCITDDIVTDEVIITEERVTHIKERHPNDYERFREYFGEIISNPDYILASSRPNTAFVLKRIEDNGERFELILRLKVQSDPSDYKNSIITFLRIKDKKWEKYLRNKKILYKRE